MIETISQPGPRLRLSVQRAVVYAILIVLCIAILSPILTAILGSLRSSGEFQARPFGLPQDEIRWEHYTDILGGAAFWRMLGNTLLITIGVTTLNVGLGSMLAFAFTRLRFWGRELLVNILSFGLLFPLVVAILPIFIQIRQLGLINSLWGVILPLVALGLPGTVIILRGFFISIPTELEDASYIDGCTPIGFFRHVLVPMARPALTAVAVLQIIAGWNNYFLPLLILNDPNLWPLTLGLQQFQGQYGTDISRVMAYVTLLVIPAIVFYLFAEKYIVTGLTGGELKG